jgi:8-oxo-dGTP pyrophosphatase MutT (NUDIX family)
MLVEIPLKSIMPNAETVEDALKEYNQYSGYKEKIAEHGLIAMELADSLRVSARAVMIRDGNVLLIYRKNAWGEYYVLPGGGIEEGETPEVAAARELQEEAGLDAVTGNLLYVTPERDAYFYYVEAKSAADPVWQEIDKQQADNIYHLEWVPLSKIGQLDVRPEEIKQALKVLA